ncbi:hypothetical protein EYC80_010382 [Monilinia laxa]|uniref:Uncharacterized protein n=1 Tax=Monilinia laxa TaxID=61186 RepID=A0A5N6JNL2_MONLA|nr:hypothetical protein EYC80_010382 [Monilinia laxa]
MSHNQDGSASTTLPPVPAKQILFDKLNYINAGQVIATFTDFIKLPRKDIDEELERHEDRIEEIETIIARRVENGHPNFSTQMPLKNCILQIISDSNFYEDALRVRSQSEEIDPASKLRTVLQLSLHFMVPAMEILGSSEYENIKEKTKSKLDRRLFEVRHLQESLLDNREKELKREFDLTDIRDILSEWEKMIEV